jgi:hypothetical protein
MKIEVLYFEGCPNSTPTLEMVKQVASELGVDAVVTTVEVNDPEQANRHRFFGSPSVQINGIDADPAVRSRTDYAYGCRMYGSAGTPPREMIEAAIREQVAS